jgi:hypothetical protein
MINVEISCQSDGKITDFAVTGHADLAASGQDIVCAGVSALTQAALLGLHEHLHRDVRYDKASGKLIMHLVGAPDDCTEAVLHTMLLGLEGIAQYSPKRVKIQVKRR